MKQDRAAIIQGSYSDLKFLKSRKVCQIVVECPIEAGDRIVEIFGSPNPAREVPVAVARLVSKPETSPEAQDEPQAHERRRFQELPLPQQAALACRDARFWAFLTERRKPPMGSVVVTSEEEAAEYVRRWCGVKDSRAELASNPQAGYRWRDLYAEYQAWRGM